MSEGNTVSIFRVELVTELISRATLSHWANLEELSIQENLTPEKEQYSKRTTQQARKIVIPGSALDYRQRPFQSRPAPTESYVIRYLIYRQLSDYVTKRCIPFWKKKKKKKKPHSTATTA